MRRLSPSIVVSVIALAVALAGTAFAGGYIITSTKQIKPSVKRALKGNRGPRGFAGVDGVNGAPGLQGAPGATSLAHIVIAEGDGTLCAGTLDCSIGTVQATCPAGTKPFGGGVITEALNGTWAGGISTSNGYIVGGDNYGSSSSADLSAFAYCSPDVQSIQFPNGAIGRSKAATLTAARLATHE